MLSTLGIWYLDRPRTRRRLLHLPLVMALGVGLAFSNARAVLEALLRIRTEFVRTPKYKVEGTSDATWKRKKYFGGSGWLPAFELSFAAYFLLAILYAASMGMWGTIPFLSLFLFGYATGRDELLQPWAPAAALCAQQLRNCGFAEGRGRLAFQSAIRNPHIS